MGACMADEEKPKVASNDDRCSPSHQKAHQTKTLIIVVAAVVFCLCCATNHPVMVFAIWLAAGKLSRS